LGNGGLSRDLCFALKNKGALVTVLSRSNNPKTFFEKKLKVKHEHLNHLGKYIVDAQILINATTVGMYPDKSSLVEPKYLHKNLIIQEMVLNPINTKLVLEAKKAGCFVITGDKTFFRQLTKKFKIFTGIDAPMDLMQKELNKILKLRGLKALGIFH
jgi:shikimate dehydrogenase